MSAEDQGKGDGGGSGAIQVAGVEAEVLAIDGVRGGDEGDGKAGRGESGCKVGGRDGQSRRICEVAVLGRGGKVEGEGLVVILVVGVAGGEVFPGERRALDEGERVDGESGGAVDVGDGQAEGERGDGAGAVGGGEGEGKGFAVVVEA